MLMSDTNTETDLVAEQKRLTDAIAAQQADMGRKSLGRPTPSSASITLMNLNRQLAAVTMKIRTQAAKAKAG